MPSSNPRPEPVGEQGPPRKIADLYADAHAAAQNNLPDEAAMWAHAALEAWEECRDDYACPHCGGVDSHSGDCPELTS